MDNTLEKIVERFTIPAALAASVLLLVLLSIPVPARSVDTGAVAPEEGVVLPIVWGDLGRQLVKVGAIDKKKFTTLYGTLTEEQKVLLEGDNPERVRITRENAPYLLNLLWALGLANTNPILEDRAEMMNPKYGGDGPPAGGFASTGGWTLASGDAMEHYGMHSLVILTKEQQALVEKLSRGIYRPCCGNSTHFPDCNHGMAMLGLLELMASQDISEEEMWRAALAVNSYWFPDTYRTIALYKQQKGVAWKEVSPQEVLGKEYSSASGFSRVAAAVAPQGKSSASCSV